MNTDYIKAWKLSDMRVHGVRLMKSKTRKRKMDGQKKLLQRKTFEKRHSDKQTRSRGVGKR